MCGKDGLADYTKVYLCSSNFCVMIIGILLVVLAVLTKSNDTIGPIIEKVPAVGTLMEYVIAMGVITFVVAAAGCLASVMKQKYILVVYSAVLGILILFKFIIAVVLFVKASKDTSADVEAMLQAQFDNKPSLYMGVENMLTCCGVTGIETYASKGLTASLTCCDIKSIGDALPGSCTAKNAHPGCESKLWLYLRPGCQALATILLLTSLFELIMLVFSLLMLKSAVSGD